MNDINLQETFSNFSLSQYATSSTLASSTLESFSSYLNNYKTNDTNVNTNTSTSTNVNANTNTSTSTNVNANTNTSTSTNANANTNTNASANTNATNTNTTNTNNTKTENTESSNSISSDKVQNEISKEVSTLKEINEKNTSLKNEIIEEVSEEIIKETEKFNEFFEEIKSKVDENLATILVYDPSLISQISEVLQVSSEDVVSTLSEMNLTISDLSKQENLISFMQEVLELENPEMLISIDSVIENMNEISQISANISYPEVIQTSYENSTPTYDLEELQDLITIPVNDLTETEDISNLLEKLSGEITEVEENIYEPTLQNLDNNSQNNSNLFNQNFNSEQFSTNQNSVELDDFSNDSFNFISQGLDTSFNYSSNLSSVSQKNVLQRNLNSLDIINQITDKMKNSLKTDTSEIKLLLRPDSLGEVSLKISTQNGIIAAQFTAESQKVKEIIEANFNLLKDMLNEKGIEVSQLDVNVNDENNSGSNSFEQFAFNQEKSEARVQSIIDKVLQDEQEVIEQEVIEYVEDNELISSNVNYSA